MKFYEHSCKMVLDSDKTQTLQTSSVADVRCLAKKVNSFQNKFKSLHLPQSRTENVSIANLIKSNILALM